MGTSGQDGVVSRHTLPPCTTTERIITKPQNKYHPEMAENRTAWKSDNHGFKEATFTLQMGRRGGDVETGGDERRCGVVQRGSSTNGMGAPDSRVVDKNQEGYLGSK